MSEPSEELLASLATEPWRPRSLQAPRPALLDLRWRVIILVAIALLHLLLGRWLLSMVVDDVAEPEVVLVVDFIDASPKPIPPPVFQPPMQVTPAKPKRKPKSVARAPATGTSPTPAQLELQAKPRAHSPDMALQALESPPARLQLYDSEGRVRLPDNMLEQIDKQVGDQRVFSYQVPHIDDARKYFHRNPALAYETTQFDQYWTPDQDALTALLTKLVEKTTKEVRIPVPGRPGSTMICKVSVLALGGGCGILVNGANYVGPVDDPNTLNPEEDRQCQAWWNQIIGAQTQDVWRRTRSLYEAQCRKPPLREQ